MELVTKIVGYPRGLTIHELQTYFGSDIVYGYVWHNLRWGIDFIWNDIGRLVMVELVECGIQPQLEH